MTSIFLYEWFLQEIQNELFGYYLKEQRKAGVFSDISEDHAWYKYSLCAMQRLMQALGAYGKLGIEKGKKEFLQYIPSALRLLKEAIEKEDFPNINSLVSKLIRQPSL